MCVSHISCTVCFLWNVSYGFKVSMLVSMTEPIHWPHMETPDSGELWGFSFMPWRDLHFTFTSRKGLVTDQIYESQSVFCRISKNKMYPKSPLQLTFCSAVEVRDCSLDVMFERLCSKAATTWAWNKKHNI